MIKKITLGLTALLSTFSASTLANPARTPIDVSVPSYNGGFTFGLAGLYIRPSSNALDYGIVFPASTNDDPLTVFQNGSVKNVEPDYDWGYKINVGYVIPCSGNDVTLSYSYFKHDEKDSLTLAKNEVFSGTVAPFLFAASDETSFTSDAKAEFKYQAADLDFGQHVNVGCNTRLRFLAGLRYANVDTKFDANYRGVIQSDSDAGPNTISTLSSQKSEYRGIGPRFGIDTEYNLGYGFSVVGQATSALLIGNIETNFHERDIISILDADPVVDIDLNTSFSTNKTTRVVPNLTAKLGLAYNYQFCNPSRTKVTVEAGYQADHFFNVVDHLSSANVTGDFSSKHTIDASFDGPYVGIQVHV